jgi:3-methylfumaryl-CoA hydratase
MALSADLASPETVATWLARRQVARDVATPGVIDRYRGTLQRPIVPASEAGTPAPLGLHRVITREPVAHDAIGPDGLARGRGLYPDLPKLGSVMWGGGTMEFIVPFRAGDEVERLSRLIALDEKNGRAGRLVFAQIAHEYSVGGVLRVRETETIAFREPSPLEITATGSRGTDLRNETWDFRRQVLTDTVMLFEFSALTFNTHRIHYDQPYATQVEKYPGLLVHGPLTGILLVDTCAAAVGSDRLASVTVRAQRPVFVGTTLTLAGRKIPGGEGIELAALDDQGRPVMFGTATLRN